MFGITLVRRRETRRRATSLLVVLLSVLLVAGTTGCGPGARKKAAQDLVKQGSGTAQKLAEYYESLAHMRERTLDLLDLEWRKLETPMNEPARKPTEEQIEALRARAATAKKLQGLYDALGKLIEYDAATEVKGAVNELKDEVIKLVDHPLSIPPLPDKLVANLLDRLVGYLVEMEQLRRFDENTPQASEVLAGIIQFYDAEKPLYTMIAQDYERLRPKAARFFGEPGVELIVSTGAFKEDVEPYGELLTKSTTNPVIAAFNRDAAGRILDRRLKAQQGVADSHSKNLYALERSTEAFLRKKPEYPLAIKEDLRDPTAFVAYLRVALREQKERDRRFNELKQMRHPDAPALTNDMKPLPSDPVSDHIVSLLSPGMKTQLESAITPRQRAELAAPLATELNRVIQSGNLYARIEEMFSSGLKQRIKEFTEMPFNRPRMELKRVALERDLLAEFRTLLSKGRYTSARTSSVTLADLQQFKILITTTTKEYRVFDLRPSGRALAMLNRRLLERAYPELSGKSANDPQLREAMGPRRKETFVVSKEAK